MDSTTAGMRSRPVAAATSSASSRRMLRTSSSACPRSAGTKRTSAPILKHPREAEQHHRERRALTEGAAPRLAPAVWDGDGVLLLAELERPVVVLHLALLDLG